MQRLMFGIRGFRTLGCGGSATMKGLGFPGCWVSGVLWKSLRLILERPESVRTRALSV